MPAIQPEKLQRQIDELLQTVDDPSAFVRSCMSLLDYYADRTKRPRGAVAKVEIAKILRIPRPVMKTICARIHQTELGLPENWLVIGNALWDKAIREARQVAACALEKSPGDEIPAVVEKWAISCEDDQALVYLTSIGLKNWRMQDVNRFYFTIRSWLKDSRLTIRHMAILALLGRAGDEDFTELPEMLRSLAGMSAALRGSSQRSMINLIRHLAQRSAPEVAKYLIDELQAGVSGADRLARSTITVFPQRLQDEIGRSLG